MLRTTTLTSLSLIALLISFASAHTVITYPGWRGNNLHTNGTVEETNGLAAYSTGNDSGIMHPYGMQWEYPCGGMPTSTNRTKWPVKGGALAFQPGWFQGHATAFIYVNLGLGEVPANMSLAMVPPFQLVGPTRDPYPGTMCLPQVPIPVNVTVKAGDFATIQVIETALHGAALYNCVDIEFADPSEVEEVTEANCFNSTELKFNLVFSTAALSPASAVVPSSSIAIGFVSVISLLASTVLVGGSIW